MPSSLSLFLPFILSFFPILFYISLAATGGRGGDGGAVDELQVIEFIKRTTMVGLLPGDPILPSFLPLPPSLTSFSLPSSLYLPFTPFLYLASFPSLTLPVALPPCVPTYLPPTPCPFLPSPFFSSFPFPSSLHFTFISPRSSPPPPLLLPFPPIHTQHIPPVPHPIIIRKYQPNRYTCLWFTAFQWGVIFMHNQVSVTTPIITSLNTLSILSNLRR